MPPPSPIPLSSAETDLIPLIEEIATVVLRNRPSDIQCFLAEYLEHRDRGLIPAPHISPDPAIAAVLARLHDPPPKVTAAKALVNDKRAVDPSHRDAKPLAQASEKSDKTVDSKEGSERHAQRQPERGPSDIVFKPVRNLGSSLHLPDERDNVKMAVLDLVDEMHALDSHVTRVRESLTSALRRSHDALVTLSGQEGHVTTTIKRHLSASACACPCPRPEPLPLRCRSSQFFQQHYSTFVRVLLGEVRIRDAPVHAAVAGWSLLGTVALLAHAYNQLSGFAF